MAEKPVTVQALELGWTWGGPTQSSSLQPGGVWWQPLLPISSSGGWLAVGHRWVILGGNGLDCEGLSFNCGDGEMTEKGGEKRGQDIKGWHGGRR